MDDNPVQVIQGRWIVIEKLGGGRRHLNKDATSRHQVTKIKQTILHPKSKTHHKHQMPCSASNATQGSSSQGQNEEDFSLRCGKSSIVIAGVNT